MPFSFYHCFKEILISIFIYFCSMDECEEVCNRLTIMAKGRMQCIGNVQHLKSLYGQGYIIMIKLKNHSEEQRNALKIEMKHIFLSKCILKDEHQVGNEKKLNLILMNK